MPARFVTQSNAVCMRSNLVASAQMPMRCPKAKWAANLAVRLLQLFECGLCKQWRVGCRSFAGKRGNTPPTECVSELPGTGLLPSLGTSANSGPMATAAVYDRYFAD